MLVLSPMYNNGNSHSYYHPRDDGLAAALLWSLVADASWSVLVGNPFDKPTHHYRYGSLVATGHHHPLSTTFNEPINTPYLASPANQPSTLHKPYKSTSINQPILHNSPRFSSFNGRSPVAFKSRSPKWSLSCLSAVLCRHQSWTNHWPNIKYPQAVVGQWLLNGSFVFG